MTKIITGAALAVIAPILALNGGTIRNQKTDQEKRNEDVIHRATEAMNRGDLKAYVSYFAEDTKHPLV